MDSIVSSALEEICARAAAGIPLVDLWLPLRPSLAAGGLPLCDAVKGALWARLVSLPSLRFQVKGSLVDPRDPSLRSVAEAERAGARIVAEQNLRDSFLGIYDLQASVCEITNVQRAVLERLAKARSKGVTQSELSKEFGIEGNKFYYIVKLLESQQLVVRQSTIVREKEYLSEGENLKITATNLVLLARYAKGLNLMSHQKLEISRGDNLEGFGDGRGVGLDVDGACGDVNGDVSVKDYLSGMKAVCDQLEQANGEFVLSSDIKKALGYKKSTGHRAWRSLLNKLKRENIVEEYQAEVNNKNVSCLRLLKKFDLKLSTHGHNTYSTGNSSKHGKRGHVTDQFVELPFGQRIYDIIDAEGRKGITLPEIGKRVGTSSKKLHNQINSLRQKFSLPWQAETIERTPAYRIWTPGNYPNDSNILDNYKADTDENDPLLVPYAASCERPKSCSFSESGNSNVWYEPNQSDGLNLANNANRCVPCTIDNPTSGCLDIVPENEAANNANTGVSCTIDNPTSGCLDIVPENEAAQSGKYCSTMTIASNFRSARRKIHECDSTKLNRDYLIRERLKMKKMILKSELYRFLECQKKDKKTKMGRRTLTHILNKLQEEGFCNCFQVRVPGLQNFARSRLIEMIFCPPVRMLTPEILKEVYSKHRCFEVLVRRESLNLKRKPVAMSGLKEFDRSHHQEEGRPVFLEAMRANGFVPAKMVRAKLLHKFFWSYLRSLPKWENALNSEVSSYDSKNCQTTFQLLEIDESVKMMPYELFLQVVGCPEELKDMVEHCKNGLRLSDIPSSEYKHLMNPLAVSRLSAVIDILIRLKLIQLVRRLPEDDNETQHAVLMHALELKPYIEEPISHTLSSNVNADFHPRIRHDFILVTMEAVDEYWETLEYCYSAIDRTASGHAFPGSFVPEISFPRSWASVRVMNTEQRMKLLERMNSVDLKDELPFKDCVRISRELNLTVEQVLRVYYDKKHGRRSRNSGGSKSKKKRKKIIRDDTELLPQKRKRSLNNCSLDQGEAAELRRSAAPVNANSAVGNADLFSHLASNDVKDSCGRSNIMCHGNIGLTADMEMHGNGIENPSSIKKSIVTRCIPKYRKRIFWSDELDRQIVIQYARARVKQGVDFYRVGWNSISDLPAPSGTCAKRMCVLNKNTNVRRSVLRLCNILSKRYERSLESGKMNLESQPFSQNSSNDDIEQDFWDNFENLDVKTALDEVIQYKRSANFEHDKRSKSRRGEDWPDTSLSEGTSLCVKDSTASEEQNKQLRSVENSEGGLNNNGVSKGTRKQSKSRTSTEMSAKLFNSSYIIIKKKVSESLAVANAVELIKLVLLNTSIKPEVQISLAKSLQMFSQSDIFAAYSYLKENNFMVSGHGNQPFVLSRKFLDRVASSPFPVDSGKRASSFSSWLRVKEHDELLKDGVNLSSDLQCGELLHLFGLVSSGEFCISPCLPNEGIGEAKVVKNSNFHSPDSGDHSNKLKRKNDKVEPKIDTKKKKQSQELKIENDCCLRREKGFYGIRVVLSRASISNSGSIELLRGRKEYSSPNDGNTKIASEKNVVTDGWFFSNSQNNLFWCKNKKSACMDVFPWDAIIGYANTLYTLWVGQSCPVTLQHELFKSVHAAIHHAGEQGLNLAEISEIIGIQGLHIAEVFVGTLEAFHLVIKVNSYDNIRVVDFAYRFKYFVQTPICQNGDQDMVSYPEFLESCSSIQEASGNKSDAAYDMEDTDTGLLTMHKVTPINRSTEFLSKDAPVIDQVDSGSRKVAAHDQVDNNWSINVIGRDGLVIDQGDNDSTKVAAHNQRKEVGHENAAIFESTFLPILPWINGDGSINTIVFKGLSRRLIGTVMQNPGITEEDIIQRMNVLNPQSCRKLMELMVLDNHLSARMLCETTSSGPPSILRNLFRSSSSKSEPVMRKHYFANPMSTNLL